MLKNVVEGDEIVRSAILQISRKEARLDGQAVGSGNPNIGLFRFQASRHYSSTCSSLEEPSLGTAHFKQPEAGQ